MIRKDTGRKSNTYGIIATIAFLALLYMLAKQINIIQTYEKIKIIRPEDIIEPEGEAPVFPVTPDISPTGPDEDEPAPFNDFTRDPESTVLPPEVTPTDQPEDEEIIIDLTHSEEPLEELLAENPTDVPTPEATGEQQITGPDIIEIDNESGTGFGSVDEYYGGDYQPAPGQNGNGSGGNGEGGGGGDGPGLFLPEDLIVFDKLADWMKKHPYRFSPELKESMEYQKGDLTSRVTDFQSSKGLYTMYLLHREHTRILAIGFAQIVKNEFDILSDASWDGVPEKYLNATSVIFDPDPDDDIREVILQEKMAADGQSFLSVFREWWVKTLK